MKKRILTLLTVIAILAGIAVPVRAEETVSEEAVDNVPGPQWLDITPPALVSNISSKTPSSSR